MKLFKRIKYYASFVTPDDYIEYWCEYPKYLISMLTLWPNKDRARRESYDKQAINAAHFGYKYAISISSKKYGFFKTRWQAHLACKILKLYQLKLRYENKIKLWIHHSGKKN